MLLSVTCKICLHWVNHKCTVFFIMFAVSEVFMFFVLFNKHLSNEFNVNVAVVSKKAPQCAQMSPFNVVVCEGGGRLGEGGRMGKSKGVAAYKVKETEGRQADGS